MLLSILVTTNLCPIFPPPPPPQENTFQAILITDGIYTYSIFIYKCGLLEWDNGVTIGFSAASDPYANHSPSSSEIACLNMENSNFTNVVYRLSDANPEYPLPRKSPLSFRLGNSLMLHLYRGPNTLKCDTDVSHRSLDNSFVLVSRGIHHRVWNRPIQLKSGNRTDSQPFKHITHQRHVQYHTVRIGR